MSAASQSGVVAPVLTLGLAQRSTINRVSVSSHSIGSVDPGLRSYSVQLRDGDTSAWTTVGEARDAFHERNVLVSFAASCNGDGLIITSVDYSGCQRRGTAGVVADRRGEHGRSRFDLGRPCHRQRGEGLGPGTAGTTPPTPTAPDNPAPVVTPAPTATPTPTQTQTPKKVKPNKPTATTSGTSRPSSSVTSVNRTSTAPASKGSAGKEPAVPVKGKAVKRTSTTRATQAAASKGRAPRPRRHDARPPTRGSSPVQGTGMPASGRSKPRARQLLGRQMTRAVCFRSGTALVCSRRTALLGLQWKGRGSHEQYLRETLLRDPESRPAA